MSRMFLSNLIKPTEAKYAELVEQDYFNYFYDTLKDLSLSMFEWENLPDGSDADFIERQLFEFGKIGFWEDEDTGKILSLKASGVSQVNMYGYNTEYRLTSEGGNVVDKVVSADDVVILNNDKLWESTSQKIYMSCIRLANIAMTIDVNVFAQKTPVIVEADDDSINSLRTMVDQFKRNVFAIFTRKTKNTLSPHEALKVHKTEAPYVADKLLNLQHDLYNDALTRLGINNTDVTKKERLITDEVNSNMMEIMGHAQSMLAEREKACKLINEKWGIETSVKLRNENMFKIKDEDVEDEESGEYYE